MRPTSIILLGFGNVGRAFFRLLLEKRQRLQEGYGLDLELRAILTNRGGVVKEDLLREPGLAEVKREDLPRLTHWRPGLGLKDILENVEPGVAVECLSSNLQSGQPALGYVLAALIRGWQVVASSKGPLAVDLKGLRRAARRAGVQFLFSAATGAALPIADVGLRSLAGSEVLALEGILNGTTNFILTRMGEGIAYERALAEAQQRGIAEPDPRNDVEGWDTAVKLLILVNLILDTDFTLADVHREGIAGLSAARLAEVTGEAGKIKLLGRLETKSGTRLLSVAPTVLKPGHPLFAVDGTEKGITFFTDTMGRLTLIGGRSDPRGAAAALVKDLIALGPSR